jgi:hypothetical protein
VARPSLRSSENSDLCCNLIGSPEVAQRVIVAIDAQDATIRDPVVDLRVLAAPGRPAAGAAIPDLVGGRGDDRRASRLLCQLDGKVDDDVPDDVSEQLLGALRDTSSNATRHSGPTMSTCRYARQAKVSLTGSPAQRLVAQSRPPYPHVRGLVLCSWRAVPSF